MLHFGAGIEFEYDSYFPLLPFLFVVTVVSRAQPTTKHPVVSANAMRADTPTKFSYRHHQPCETNRKAYAIRSLKLFSVYTLVVKAICATLHRSFVSHIRISEEWMVIFIKCFYNIRTYVPFFRHLRVFTRLVPRLSITVDDRVTTY